MKNRKPVLIAVVVLMLVFPAIDGLAAEWHEFVETIGTQGSINWSIGIIAATGIGVPYEEDYGESRACDDAIKAAEAAETVARRSLLEATRCVRVDSATLVKNFMAESDVIQSQVSGMVKKAQTVKKEYLSDGTVKVTVAMSLRGGFAQLMLPGDIKQVPEIKTIPPVPLAPANKEKVSEASIPQSPGPTTQTVAPAIYTGLVLDARGLNARPAMSPRILDENGQEVYGSAYVSRELVVQHGMAGYARDLTASQTNPRVIDKPFTVKGLRIKGPGRSDFVISNADAAKIRSASESLSFLKKCRVMIVLD